MKRIVLTMSLAVCITGAFAQTQDMEIRRSDMSYPGQSFQFKEDTSVALPDTFQDAGQNRRWDFSNLDDNGSYTTRFLAPDSTNGGDSVENCNLVIQDDDQYDEYTFINASDSALKVVNTSEDSLGTYSDFSPRAMIFPLKYGTAWADSSRTDDTYTGDEFGVPLDSIRVQIYILINYSCDGQGQLILPVDSVETLRVKQDVYYEYAVSGYSALAGGWFPIESGSDGQLSYSFVNKEGGYYAATVAMKADQTNVGEVSYRSATLMNVKKPAGRNEARLYPNPVYNQFQIEAKQAGAMQIYDLQGKLVKTHTPVIAGTNHFEMNDLQSGQYLVVIVYKDGSSSVNRIIKR